MTSPARGGPDTAGMRSAPDPRFRDQLAGWLAEHVFCTGEYGDGWTTPREESYSCSCGVEFGEWIQGRDDSADWDPNQDWREHVAAEVEARVQAAANQRAAEELRAAADELVKDGRPDLTTIDQVQAVNDAAGWLDARADTLAAAAQPTDGRTGE